jgi:hypothetical protein
MDDVEMSSAEAVQKHKLQEDFDAAEEEMEEERTSPERSISAFQRILSYRTNNLR